MNLLDVVVLTQDRPELGLRAGQVGTIVEVYSSDEFEVEFVNRQTGRTYAIETFTAKEILKLIYEPVSMPAA